MKWVKANSAHVGGAGRGVVRGGHRGSVVAEHSVQRLGHGGKECCSAAFVAGRPADADPHGAGRHPASPALKLISTEINEAEHTVTSKFLGLFKRQASLVSKRGCVLDEPADPTAVPYSAAAPDPAPWPQGDAVTTGVDTAKLRRSSTMRSSAPANRWKPTPAGGSGAGRQIAHRSGRQGHSAQRRSARLVDDQDGRGNAGIQEVPGSRLDIETPVIDAFPDGKAPEWVEQWRGDERAQITVADLMFMRAGEDG